MLPSLGIRNYRNLKHLDIEKLARVNLIAGKNNTGKTSLLEAVSLYAAGGSLDWVNILLKSRGDYHYISLPEQTYMPSILLDSNIKSYRSLFFQRPFDNQSSINIESLKSSASDGLTIRFDYQKRSESSAAIMNVALLVGYKRTLTDYPLDTNMPSTIASWVRSSGIFSKEDASPAPDFQFVGTKESLRYNAAQLWSNIALKDEEDWVVEALKIIDPRVSRISFIDDKNGTNQKAVVRMSDHEEILPLQSMGDGMNRILTIILALVNAGDSYLLIDEFENGLHHTVQEDLWKMIFKLAKELNVQVFATTHSDDCIRAFERVLNSDGNESEGQYFRLERFGDVIKPIFYSPSELEVATDQNIETR